MAPPRNAHFLKREGNQPRSCCSQEEEAKHRTILGYKTLAGSVNMAGEGGRQPQASGGAGRLGCVPAGSRPHCRLSLLPSGKEAAECGAPGALPAPLC